MKKKMNQYSVNPMQHTLWVVEHWWQASDEIWYRGYIGTDTWSVLPYKSNKEGNPRLRYYSCGQTEVVLPYKSNKEGNPLYYSRRVNPGISYKTSMGIHLNGMPQLFLTRKIARTWAAFYNNDTYFTENHPTRNDKFVVSKFVRDIYAR